MDIIIKDLSYTYHAHTPFERKVLHHISLEIKQGKWIAILGRTGSGKSTLVQQMNGLLQPTQGTVKIGSELIHADRRKMPRLYDQVGMVFQYPEHQLFEETVKKDIAYGPKNLGWSKELIEQRVERMIKKVGLPQELLHRSPLQLSGGQKRKAAIAGTLVMDPEVLILDEPTAGLDPTSRQDILGLIHDWQSEGNRTVITITHQMEDVTEYADEVVVLEKGKVKYHMDPVTLFTQHAKDIQHMGLELPYALKLLHELNKGLQKPISVTSAKKEEILSQIARHFQTKGLYI